MNLIFQKYQAYGNDYLVYDCIKNTTELSIEQIKKICDRHYGIGADGILIGPIQNSEDAGSIGVRIFNPDGSEAEKSGNGIRIFAKYLRDQGYVWKDQCVIHTISGKVTAQYLNHQATKIRVEMGEITFNSKLVGVSGPERDVINELFVFDNKGYQCTCVSVGNPHCVIPMEEVSREKAEYLGKYIEKNAYFKNGTNTQLMQVIDRNTIKIEVYERGAGYTLSSGTSSCAAAAAAVKLGLTENEVNVITQGGVFEVTITKDNHAILTGEAEYIGGFLFNKKFF